MNNHFGDSQFGQIIGWHPLLGGWCPLWEILDRTGAEMVAYDRLITLNKLKKNYVGKTILFFNVSVNEVKHSRHNQKTPDITHSLDNTSLKLLYRVNSPTAMIGLVIMD